MMREAPAPRPGWARALRLAAIYAALFALLYFALQSVPLPEIWETLQRLRPAQLGIIFILNALVILAISLRWWAIVRADSPRVPLLPLIGYRLTVFGVSYFTPGPQVGGEPLQVLYLERNHGLTFARATAAVIMDKLMELLANFVLLCLGLAATLRLGLLPALGAAGLGALIPFVLLLLWPVVHLALLYRGQHPISALLELSRPLLGSPRWTRLIAISERMASRFMRRRPLWLLASLAFSLLAMAGMALEYYLFAAFLAVPLNAWQVLIALTANLVAFLLPLPGGLGALEASQVLVMRAFGQPAAVGISIALLMRARDVINGGLGLLIAGRGLHR